MIVAAVTYVIKSGHETEAVEFLSKMVEPTRAEPGCRFYLPHRSTTEPRKFFLYEQYDDENALENHRGSAHFELYVKNGLLKIIESRSPELYAPLGS